jgi:hypothetical protein
LGAYAAKVCGSGDRGFILFIAESDVRQLLIDFYSSERARSEATFIDSAVEVHRHKSVKNQCDDNQDLQLSYRFGSTLVQNLERDNLQKMRAIFHLW